MIRGLGNTPVRRLAVAKDAIVEKGKEENMTRPRAYMIGHRRGDQSAGLGDSGRISKRGKKNSWTLPPHQGKGLQLPTPSRNLLSTYACCREPG